MSFPVRPAEITVEWLNVALNARGLLGARKIVGFEVAPAANRGGTSSVRVLTLTYDQPAASLPRKVLAKFSSESPEVREKARQHRLYQREIAFYKHHSADPGIPTPVCYTAEYEERSNTCVLLLQYIENARSRDVYEGGAAEIEAAVRCLAPFHARWWNQGAALAGIESEHDTAALARRLQKVNRAFQRIQDGGHRQSLGNTSYAILELWLAHGRTLADYCRRRSLTLCHGSFHRGQLLFPDSGSGLPWVIDWQSASLDVGAFDLARIVVSGLLPDQRRQHERRLVALYHHLLLQQGVRDYSREDLFKDYRLGIINLIVFHSLILADYPVEVIAKYWKEKDSFWDMLFQWPGEAAQEWDALGWIEQLVPSLPRGS